MMYFRIMSKHSYPREPIEKLAVGHRISRYPLSAVNVQYTRTKEREDEASTSHRFTSYKQYMNLYHYYYYSGKQKFLLANQPF